MKKIGVAVGAEFESQTIEDKFLTNRLRILGFDAQPLVWDRAGATNKDFDAVVVQSCWGYHKQPRKFLNWVAELETNAARVLNAPEILRWNFDKIYLRELAEQNVRLPPTIWFEKGEIGSLTKTLAENGWQKVVLKPRVSATAWRTFVVAPENSNRLQPELEKLLATDGAMIQKFVEEIETKGEWSFIFFDKQFSHSVLKRTKPGDFRVQQSFGGTVEINAKPAVALIEAAQRIVDGVDADLLYARVDGVEVSGELILMELELIEPLLFLENNESALQKFAQSVASRF